MKKRKLFIITICILTIIFIPTSLAFYFTSKESPLTTKFDIEYNSIFIRAEIITYWVDNKEEIIGKSDWTIDETKLSNNWTKIDDYYYYNGTLSKTQLEKGIPVSELLIEENKSSEEITNDDIRDNKYTAKYKVVYELLEADNENNILSSEEAWGITYSESGIPSKK